MNVILYFTKKGSQKIYSSNLFIESLMPTLVRPVNSEREALNVLRHTFSPHTFLNNGAELNTL